MFWSSSVYAQPYQGLEYPQMNGTLRELRLAYERETNRSLAMPTSGVFGLARDRHIRLPAPGMLAVPAVIVIVYLISLLFMVRRPIPSLDPRGVCKPRNGFDA